METTLQLASPLNKLILLAVVLAVGFLFNILAGALYGNWLSWLVLALFAFSPMPNLLCDRVAQDDDFMNENTNYVKDFGRWASAFMLVSSFGLPIMLCHCDIFTTGAAMLSILGGFLVYLTIVIFTLLFDSKDTLAL